MEEKFKQFLKKQMEKEAEQIEGGTNRKGSSFK